MGTMDVEVDKTRAVIVLLLNEYYVDTRKVAGHLGVGPQKVDLCKEARAHDYTGYQFRGTSPIGTKQCMRVLAQVEVEELDEIFVSGGLPDLVVSLSRQDLQ